MSAGHSRAALVLVLLGVAATATCGGSEHEPPTGAKKVLLIGIDGVRPDVLAEVETPNLDRLADRGTFADDARTGFPTMSGPGWSSFLTGVWPDKHGVTTNEFENKHYDAFPDVFTRIESLRPDLNTWVAADWLPLVTSDHNGPVISDAVDTKHVLDGYEVGWSEGDELTVELAAEALAESDPDAMFVYLGNPDETSHQHTSIGLEYRSAIELADEHVGRLVGAIEARPTYDQEDWLILVSTDHGRRANGGHGGDTPEERTIFYIASGPSATVGRAGVETSIVDVPVTALAHLGIPIDPAWNLDGKVVGLGR
ncbi:MAG: alkaline phosphatase family protein [Gemmatimonadota bacterium]|nr:alkaline phosphatase family protein [Gemmatimonadota bacterium]MDH3422049.1 alkaline phosphatase family protein [Gemmatimonadota bacterium]